MAIMRTLKEAYQTITDHPQFKPIALTLIAIICTVGTILSIIYRVQIGIYLQNLFADPIAHADGVKVLVGGVVLTTTGILFGFKWLCQKYFF